MLSGKLRKGGALVLRVFGRVFLTIIVPLYGGYIGVLKGWLIMSVVVLVGAGPAFAIGYFIARISN